MALPLVSVLITSYNRATLIEETINSVLSQTYKNYEIIIVDNCSTDNTKEVLSKYSGDERIRIYFNESNIGQFPNRNRAATYAKGKYLKYLDSDDLLYPTGLEVLVNMMEQFPEAGYGLCSLAQDNSKPYPFILSPEESYRYHYEKYTIFEKAPLSSIIKKEAFEKIKGFDVAAICGDFAFWLKMASHYSVVLMPDGVVWYRFHVAQEMQKARDSLKIGFEYLKAEEMLVSENSNISEAYKTKLMHQNKVRQMKFCFYVLRRLRMKEFFSMWKIYRTDPKMYFQLSH